MNNSKLPLFKQIKNWISDQIINETFKAHDQIPSTNELVEFFEVNHITILKGVNQLVEESVIYKKRGVGMFVAENAREKLLEQRKEAFKKRYLEPLVKEMQLLDIEVETLDQMVKDLMKEELR